MKKKYLCKICGRFFRHIHGPELSQCYTCFKKSKTVIPSGPTLFNEEITKKIQINVGLTESQSEVLIKRLDSLCPNRNLTHELQGVSNYVRELIFADLIKFEQDVEDVE